MPISDDELVRTILLVRDPYTSQSLEQLGISVELKRSEGSQVQVELTLPRPLRASRDDWSRHIHEALQAAGQDVELTVRTTLNVTARTLVDGDPAPSIKQMVLVMSGKGGVGKSTVAVHLAAWLRAQGRTVALADCDTQQSSSEWSREALPEVLAVRLSTADEIIEQLPQLDRASFR